MGELKEFEGKEVTEVGIEIRGVSGGLQEAVKFAPVEWEQGSEHYIVVRCVVESIRLDPVEKKDYTGEQRRVHIMPSLEAFPIAAKYVEKAFDEKRAEIKRLKDEAEGTPALDLDNEGDLPIGAKDELEPLGDAEGFDPNKEELRDPEPVNA